MESVRPPEGEPSDYRFKVLGKEGPASPAGQVGAEQMYGKDLYDPEALQRLADSCDVMTIEIEHTNAPFMRTLRDRGYVIHPSPDSLATIQDKLTQKDHYTAHDIPVAPYVGLDTADDFGDAWQQFGDIIVKGRTGGYDGRSNLVIEPGMDWQSVTDFFTDAHGNRPQLYAEQLIGFERELAVIGVRDVDGNVVIYPPVQTKHVDNICHTVLAPAGGDAETVAAAAELGRKTIASFEGAGIFAVEMLDVGGGGLLVNESAPRPHNSGHYSIIGAKTSQFKNHILAVTGQELGSTAMTAPAAAMVNILGHDTRYFDASVLDQYRDLPGVEVNWYGKTPRVSRKLGHVTVLGDSADHALEWATRLRNNIDV